MASSTLTYRSFGHGSEALIFVHGWPDDGRLWDRQVAFFAKRYRCVCITLPGFDAGAAGAIAVGATQELVDGLRRAIVEVSPNGPVTIVAHDWGCLYAYELIKSDPQLVGRLVAVDVGDAAYCSLLQVSWKGLALIVAYQSPLILAHLIGGSFGDLLTRKVASWFKAPRPLAEVSSRMNYPYYLFWKKKLGALFRSEELELPFPFLYMYGAAKPFQFQTDRWLARLGGQREATVIAFDTGHWPMVEQADHFNRLLEAWLKGGFSQG